jgi:hypothetical protein
LLAMLTPLGLLDAVGCYSAAGAKAMIASDPA